MTQKIKQKRPSYFWSEPKVNQPPDGANKQLRINGLGQVIIKPLSFGAFFFKAKRMGGEGCDRTRVSLASEPQGGLIAVELWHLNIHQNDVIRLTQSFGDAGLSRVSDVHGRPVHR